MKGKRQCEGGGWGWGHDVFVIGRVVEVLNMSSGQVRSLLPPTTVQSCSGAEIQEFLCCVIPRKMKVYR